MKDALKVGVELKDMVAFLRSLIVRLVIHGTVIGVEGDDLANKCPFKKTAKIVVDCTGVTSVLRTNLPIKSFIQRRIHRDDLEGTGRYIYNFEIAKEDKTYFDPNYCIIHLDQKLAPGGTVGFFLKEITRSTLVLAYSKKPLIQ